MNIIKSLDNEEIEGGEYLYDQSLQLRNKHEELMLLGRLRLIMIKIYYINVIKGVSSLDRWKMWARKRNLLLNPLPIQFRLNWT